MLATQVRHRQITLGLTQLDHDLGLGETALLHRNLLVHRAEKILLPHPLNHGEDYRIFWIARTGPPRQESTN